MSESGPEAQQPRAPGSRLTLPDAILLAVNAVCGTFQQLDRERAAQFERLLRLTQKGGGMSATTEEGVASAEALDKLTEAINALRTDLLGENERLREELRQAREQITQAQDQAAEAANRAETADLRITQLLGTLRRQGNFIKVLKEAEGGPG